MILVLILFPFGELLRWDLGGNVVLKPLDVAVGLVAVIFFIKNSPFSIFHFPFVKPVLCFALVGLVSLLLNLTWLKLHDFWASSLYLVRWVAYAMLFPVILSFDEKFKKKLLALLFIDGLIILSAGYLQFVFFNSLKSLYYLGWDDHMYRMFTVFLDPNFAGALLVLFALFLAGVITHHLQKKESKMSAYIGVLLVIVIVAVFLTFSRSALLMLVAGSVTFLFLTKRKRLIFGVLGVVSLFIIVASLSSNIESMNPFRINSSKARLGNYSTALRLIHDRPLLGVGFDSYRYAKDAYGIRQGWAKSSSHADAGVDNSFLFVLVTTGVVGLSVYLWLWFAILKRAFYLYKKNANVIAIVVVSSTAGLFVDAMFINSLFFPAIMLWMWVIIGLMENK